MSKWMVYILRCSDGTLYTGATNNIKRRVNSHQSGKGAKYTCSRLPVELAYTELHSDKSSALKAEASIKRMKRPEKLAMIGETDE